MTKWWLVLSTLTFVLGTVFGVLGTAVWMQSEDRSPSAQRSDETSNAEMNQPETTTITVELHDSAPLEMLFNKDDATCMPYNLGELLGIGMANPDASPGEVKNLAPKVTITLKDSGGTLLGTQELPEVGGSFGGGGCTWPVEFKDVQISDFYEAIVTREDITHTGTGDGSSPIRLTF